MTEAAESVILTTGWPCVEKVVDRFILGETEHLNRDLLGAAGHSLVMVFHTQGALCCRIPHRVHYCAARFHTQGALCCRIPHRVHYCAAG